MLYFQILKFSFLRFFAYPTSISIILFRTIIEIIFLIYFWSLIGASGAGSFQTLTSYFLIANGISVIMMAQWGEFAGYIARTIRMGRMSNYLIKPYNTILYMHATAVGREGIQILFAILMILIGLAIQPPPNLFALGLFIIFFILAYAISFAINVLIGTIYFHTPSANGILNAINHTIGIFSGLVVPLYLFPQPWYQIVSSLPFAGMIYGPTIALKTSQLTNQILLNLGIVLFWAILLNILALQFWRVSTKKYEAEGI